MLQKSLGFISPAQLEKFTSQVFLDRQSIWMLSAMNLLLEPEALAENLLSLGVFALSRQSQTQVIHRRQGLGVLWPEQVSKAVEHAQQKVLGLVLTAPGL